MSNTTTPIVKPLIGLAKQAYTGAPHGVRNAWPDDLDLSPKPHWSYKTKRVRRQEILDTM